MSRRQTSQTKQNRGSNNNAGSSNGKINHRSSRGKQGSKDSQSKRVNFDNERESKFDKWIKGAKAADCNDVAWYAHSPELLRSAASLPFSTTSGQPIFNKKFSIPGVMEINWVPNFEGGNESALQQAANGMYSYIVHANSRNYNYDPADLMIMVLAGANIFAGLAIGIRAYGVARKYDQQNAYTPDALVRAMGFYANDLRNNLSKAWFDLNTLIAKARQIWIPNTMPVIERWFWMSSNVYRDGESVKSQFYVFNPTNLYYYSETGDPHGSSLVNLPWGGTVHTWEQYVAFMDKMLDALINAQDRGMIFGDILNAYGADRLYAVSDIASDYEIQFTQNLEVQSQIENLTVVPANIIGLTQDANGMLKPQYGYVPIGTPNWTGIGMSVLNFHQLTLPTPEQIMVATRLKTSGIVIVAKDTNESITQYKIRPQEAGTEFVTNVIIYSYDWRSGKPSLVGNQLGMYVSAAGSTMNLSDIHDWASFDWAPWFYLVDFPSEASLTAGSVVNVIPQSGIGDYDNYTTVSGDVLRKMHTTAVYSEFGVPTSI